MSPAASKASTVYEYCVEAVSPVSVYEADVLVPTFAPFRYTSYPVTAPPEPAVAAVHVNATELAVWLGEARPVGAPGAAVEFPSEAVVAVTAVEAPERFPAASKALTVYAYDVDAVRPVSVNSVGVGTEAFPSTVA
jgi:hypothetical protein